MKSAALKIRTGSVAGFLLAAVAIWGPGLASVASQNADRQTPLQRKIEQQKPRLASSDVEERRDALMKLGGLKHADASRAAVTSLNDPEPIIRIAAAHAITSLPPDDAAKLLIPLLSDKLEFVRREIAYALGETRSRSVTPSLIQLLSADKEPAVRAAAANALGQIRDESAVPALSQALSGVPGKKKPKDPENEFVMRAAAEALGQIRSRAAVNVLIATLTDDTSSIDLRREAANSLGKIGDPAATAALESARTSDDPYLAQSAQQALRRIRTGRN